MVVLLAAGLYASVCNIHPVYALTPAEGQVRVARAGARYRASASITFRVRQVRAATIVSVEPGVLEHVRGHAIIAQRVARAASGRIQADGATAAQARAQLAATIRKVAAEQNRELLREERAYENVTQNGAAQSQGPSYGMPGGADVQDAGCTR